MADQDLLMTRHEAARRAGVTFNTILLWIRAGRLHPVADPDVGRPSLRLSEVDAVVRDGAGRVPPHDADLERPRPHALSALGPDLPDS